MFKFIKKRQFDLSKESVDIFVSIAKKNETLSEDFIILPSDVDTVKFFIKVKSSYKADAPYDEEQLSALYDKIFAVAVQKKCQSIAIELLGADNPNCSAGLCFSTAIKKSREFQKENEIDVTIVVSKFSAIDIYTALNPNLNRILDRITYVRMVRDVSPRPKRTSPKSTSGAAGSYIPRKLIDEIKKKKPKPFSEYLKELLEEKQVTGETVYTRGNIDKKYFSKLMNDKIENPSKDKLLQLAVGFQLNIDETNELLKFMGYALSENRKIDCIFKEYIEECKYSDFDIYDINGAVFLCTGKSITGDE